MTLHAGISEKITVSDGQTFNADHTGIVSGKFRVGTFTFAGSDTGKSFIRTIDVLTNDVYVMPEGTVVYWSGHKKFNFDITSPYDQAVSGRRVTYNTNTITANVIASQSWAINFVTTSKVNIAGAKKLKALFDVTDVYSYSITSYFGVFSRETDASVPSLVRDFNVALTAAIGTYELEVDLTGYTVGSNYIGFRIGSESITIRAIWLE